jgi:hypothetical protein
MSLLEFAIQIAVKAHTSQEERKSTACPISGPLTAHT